MHHNNIRRFLIPLLIFAGLVVLGVGLYLSAAPTVSAQGGEGETPPTEEAADNSYCAICHSQQGRVMTLQDGSVLDLYVSPVTIADSVHGTSNPDGALGCVDCHGEDIFPHSGPSPESARAYRIQASQLCSDCHNELLADSAHLEALAAGDLRAATCVDCHGAHSVPATEDQPTLVAEVCSNCHDNSFTEWRESPHADMGTLGCAVCHLPHGQQLRIEDTNTLCLNCHKVPEEIYIHARHLASEYPVSCASCHMAVHQTIQPVSTGPEPTDHRMVVQTNSCNDCHEELDATGVWAQLRDTNEEVVIERDALRQQLSSLEEQLSARNENQSDSAVGYEQLIQGLIVGLGAAAIILLILIPRLTRNTSSTNVDNTDENNDESE